MILDDPSATVGPGIESGGRRSNETAVTQRRTAIDADKAAPGSCAHDWADFFEAEEPRKQIAPGAGELVDEHDFGSVDADRRIRNVLAIANGDDRQERALEFFGVEIGNLAAGVEAFVDDHAGFVELSAELLVKGDDAGNAGVRNMHVTNAAAGRFRDFPAVGLNPIEIAEAGVVADGFYRDFPRAIRAGLAVDFQSDEFSGQVLEVGIDILGCAGFPAVYRDQKVAGFHFQTGIGQRRAGVIVPVFAGINFRDAIEATVGLQISSEHTDADVRFFRLIAAADIGVRGAEFGDKFADEIVEIAAMGYPGEKRFVTSADFAPVVAGHVWIPVG